VSEAAENAAGVTRRERLRQQLMRDVMAAAREIAAEGLEGFTLTAVARKVGVSPPALYRYYDGKKGLIQALYRDLTEELMREVREAVERQDEDDIAAQLYASTKAVLDWSVANREGFNLVFGATYPMIAGSGERIPRLISEELGGMYGRLFGRLWRQGVLTYPADEEIAPELRDQLKTYRDAITPDLPVGVVYLMITCWRQIYGVLTMAVNKHLDFAIDDIEPLFNDMFGGLIHLLGLEPPSQAR